MAEPAPCTCHPDDRPPVCQRRYAAGECRAAWDAEDDLAIPEFLRRRKPPKPQGVFD